MGVLLTILKVVGIILAVLAGLILLAVCAVLFVGISYEARVQYSGDVTVKARVSWLWRLLYCSAVFAEKKLKFKVRVFGIPVISSDRMEKKKAKQNASKEAEKTDGEFQDGSKDTHTEISDDDITDAMADNIEVRQLTRADLPDGSTGAHEEGKDSAGDGAWKTAKEVDALKAEADAEASKEDSRRSEDGGASEEDSGKETGEGEKIPFSEKIASLIEKLQAKLHALTGKAEALIEKVRLTKDKVCGIINDEENRVFFKKVWQTLIVILKKFLPKKHRFRVRYGSDNPASTGQVTGYVAMAMAALPIHLTYTPDFEREVVEVDGYVYGKIRVISIVIPLLKIVFNKQFKKLRKQLQQ